MKIKERVQRIKKSNLQISKGYSNTLKCSKGRAEGLSHKITKFWIANYCWEHSLEFASEVVFKDNQRADIVIKDWNVAIEVLGTESVKDFSKKRYPMPAVPVSAMMPVKDILAMMKDIEQTDGDGADYYIRKHMNDLATNKRKYLIKTMEDMA